MKSMSRVYPGVGYTDWLQFDCWVKVVDLDCTMKLDAVVLSDSQDYGMFHTRSTPLTSHRIMIVSATAIG